MQYHQLTSLAEGRVVPERMNESLVALVLTLGVDVTDILVFND
jgi:hypothetical protein